VEAGWAEGKFTVRFAARSTDPSPAPETNHASREIRVIVTHVTQCLDIPHWHAVWLEVKIDRFHLIVSNRIMSKPERASTLELEIEVALLYAA
jgi:hypothetical protein